MSEVEAYLAGLPAPQREVLEAIRAVIRAAAPDAVEGIAYGMPAYRLGGRFLVSFGGYQRHCSLFPASGRVRGALGRELEPYLAGRGTIRFTPSNPLDGDLVRRIVEVRVAEVLGD